MDFVRSEPGDDPIIVESYFPVTPSRVFQALTDPKIVVQWFGLTPNSLHSASIDLKVGGAWEFVKSIDENKSVKFEGTYLDIRPSEHLSFTWSLVTEYKNGIRDATQPSHVTISMNENGPGTDVKLVHSSVDSDKFFLGFAKGWEAAFNSLHGVCNE